MYAAGVYEKTSNGLGAMRSFLFVPGDDEKKLNKSLTSGADALILDLEDSVAADNKSEGRKITAEFIKAHAQSDDCPTLFVRINDLETAFWETDLDAIVETAPRGLILPKARSGDDVHRLSIALDHLETRAGLDAGSIELIVLTTEVPIALLQMASFVDSSARLRALTWGAEDLSAVIGSRTNREEDGNYTSPYELARNLCLITSAAANVEALDTVYTNFRDIDGLRREAEIAARDGFSAKMAIHPGQVPIINEAFTPSSKAVDRARAIVASFENADNAGVVSLDGEMLDRPHLRLAERLLERAKSAGVI